ncbi:MAG: HEAT repeat domain-containing protein [Promethearchaeota archaeon]
MIGNKNSWSTGDSIRWDTIRLSEITIENIQALAYNLTLDLSENFYIAFDSLEKIGVKAQKTLVSTIKSLKKDDWRKKILNYLANSLKDSIIALPLVSRLYHPDFIQRARAIIIASELSGGIDYFDYILPLLDDPDDSVRWAVLNFLEGKKLLDSLLVQKKLRGRIKIEKNEVILQKMNSLIKTRK